MQWVRPEIIHSGNQRRIIVMKTIRMYLTAMFVIMFTLMGVGCFDSGNSDTPIFFVRVTAIDSYLSCVPF